jgi:hypothetical protein
MVLFSDERAVSIDQQCRQERRNDQQADQTPKQQ